MHDNPIGDAHDERTTVIDVIVLFGICGTFAFLLYKLLGPLL